VIDAIGRVRESLSLHRSAACSTPPIRPEAHETPGHRASTSGCSIDIRQRLPDVALRTTFIVGFPGETDADFADLQSFVEAFASITSACYVLA
jgi:ribosomal protein S12 methylthiotransferase